MHTHTRGKRLQFGGKCANVSASACKKRDCCFALTHFKYWKESTKNFFRSHCVYHHHHPSYLVQFFQLKSWNMPPLLLTSPSAPIIIPITVLIVVIVAIILLIYHAIRKLVGCPHQKSNYPFIQDHSKRKSVLPTSPYTIDPNSSTSSNSIYFVKGSHAGSSSAAMLYPALAVTASAPSRTPSTGRPDSSFDRSASSTGQDQTFSLDTVDGPDDNLLIGSESIQKNEGEESHALISRSSSASPTSPYHVEERTTYRQEMSYSRSERQEFVDPYNQEGSEHFESDV